MGNTDSVSNNNKIIKIKKKPVSNSIKNEKKENKIKKNIDDRNIYKQSIDKNIKQNILIKPEIDNRPESSKKKNHIDYNSALIERSMFSNINNNLSYYDYPKNSNNELEDPKKNLDHIRFDPNCFNNLDKFKNELNHEKENFEKDQLERKKKFDKEYNKKNEYLQKQIEIFEKNYDPWEILGLEYNTYDIDKIKKAYKKNALKYHPDKVGKKYEDKFQLITQSYIYLLKKSEEYNDLDIKMNKKVESIIYEDDINDKVENIYISKDKFDIEQFNKIFDKYKVPNLYDKGYSEIMNNKVPIEDENDNIFGLKFNHDIFNSHFEKKKNKKSNELIEYKEPIALETSLSNYNNTFLGQDEINDFGSVNSGGLSYTDYKKAHIDETLLIDVNKVNYKKYKSVEQLENDRSNISYVMSSKEKEKYDYIERKVLEDEQIRLNRIINNDKLMKNYYNKNNRKLIIHK
jgi:hypothetical protein